MDGGAWWAAVHGVAKNRTWLVDFAFTFHFHALEKEMATDSSVLAWRIPGTGEPGGLPSMGSHRVGHDWSDLAAAGNFGIFKTVIIDKRKPFRNDRLSLSLGCFWDIPILAQEGNPVSPLKPSLFYPLYVPGLQRQVSLWMYPPFLQLLRVNVIMWSPLLIFLLMCMKDRVTLFL